MRRLGISLLVVVIIAIIGAGWVIDGLFKKFQTPDGSIHTATTLGSQLATQLDYPGAELRTAQLASIQTQAVRAIELSLLGRDELAIPDSLQPILDSSEPLILESEKGISLYFLLPETNRVLSVNLPSSADTQLRLILTLLFYSTIVVLVLLWLFPLVRRLHKLAASAKQFGEGELNQRIATHSRSQLHDIEFEFNRMAQKIQDLVSDNKLLSSAVSHDLRTPLARLRFGIDALSEQVAEPVQLNYVNRISDDLTSMEELVEVLLEFAQLDQRLNQLPLQSVSLLELLEECVNTYKTDTSLQLSLNVSCNPVQIRAEPRYLKMMFNNVLNNACKFANSEVQVNVTSVAEDFCVCVEDDGPGFDGADTARLIKPFEKGDNQREGNAPKGHGIGLAIVNRIAAWHRIMLVLSDTPVGGAKVCMYFQSSLSPNINHQSTTVS